MMLPIARFTKSSYHCAAGANVGESFLLVGHILLCDSLIHCWFCP